jgi:hypothetical protein
MPPLFVIATLIYLDIGAIPRATDVRQNYIIILGLSTRYSYQVLLQLRTYFIKRPFFGFYSTKLQIFCKISSAESFYIDSTTLKRTLHYNMIDDCGAKLLNSKSKSVPRCSLAVIKDCNSTSSLAESNVGCQEFLLVKNLMGQNICLSYYQELCDTFWNFPYHISCYQCLRGKE